MPGPADREGGEEEVEEEEEEVEEEDEKEVDEEREMSDISIVHTSPYILGPWPA